MKKVFISLMAVTAALVACNNKYDVVNPAETQQASEFVLKSISSTPTRGAELTGTILPNSYGIYAAATQKNAGSIIENPNFFEDTEQLFGTEDADPSGTDARLWHAGAYSGDPLAFAAAPLYWPIGGVKMDFLAYAMPMADHNDMASAKAADNAKTDWIAYWDNNLTDVASKLSFNGIDTYQNQVDVLYSYANAQTSAANAGVGKSVKMKFDHAQALLLFNIKLNSEDVDNVITIDEIAFYTDERVDAMRADQVSVAAGNAEALAALTDADVTLKTIGTFTVDNSRIDLIAGWSGLSAVKENFMMPGFVGTPAVSLSNQFGVAKTQAYGAPVAFVDDDNDDAMEYVQLGETLLIPQQDKVKFCITYTMGGKTFFYQPNNLRGVWEAGKKYIYNLDLTINEIVITEKVADFVAAPELVNL